MENTSALVPVGEQGVETFEERDVISVSALNQLINPIRTEEYLPIHEQFLQAIEDSEQREALANAYYGSEPRSFKEFIGEKHAVLGMILFQHGPYKGKDGKEHPEGYFQVQLLLNEKDSKGRYIVVKSASTRLAMHIISIVKSRGWFRFEQPREYIFSQGSNGAHFLYDVDLVV